MWMSCGASRMMCGKIVTQAPARGQTDLPVFSPAPHPPVRLLPPAAPTCCPLPTPLAYLKALEHLNYPPHLRTLLLTPQREVRHCHHSARGPCTISRTRSRMRQLLTGPSSACLLPCSPPDLPSCPHIHRFPWSWPF